METAGKTLDEKELSDAMKESGLGTPATRASIIEVLLKREYIIRSGKNLEATDKGIQLIEVVHPEVKSPAMTGEWEAQLARIERGTADFDAFMTGIRDEHVAPFGNQVRLLCCQSVRDEFAIVFCGLIVAALVPDFVASGHRSFQVEVISGHVAPTEGCARCSSYQTAVRRRTDAAKVGQSR